ncbi:hypothetical protein pipiens_017736 [Culex pipiens pipiens]|uniref:Cytochrome P450 n=1 Tax=Culex pipiens pipiens TaxID=38569 RepID=A0ABD1CF64_CULPP
MNSKKNRGNEVVDNYPILTTALGGSLLMRDFDKRWPGSRDKYFGNFPKLLDTIIRDKILSNHIFKRQISEMTLNLLKLNVQPMLESQNFWSSIQAEMDSMEALTPLQEIALLFKLATEFIKKLLTQQLAA